MRVFVVTYQQRIKKAQPEGAYFKHRQVWAAAKPRAFVSRASALMFINALNRANVPNAPRVNRHAHIHELEVESYSWEV